MAKPSLPLLETVLNRTVLLTATLALALVAAPVANAAGKPRLLVVAGASGTGKSSLVRAGAVPDILATRGGDAGKAALERHEALLREAEKVLTLRRERDARAAPEQELLPGDLLKLGEGARNRGLGQMELVGRPLQAALADDFHESRDVADLYAPVHAGNFPILTDNDNYMAK